MTRKQKIVSGVIAAIVVLIAAAVLVVATFDWNRVKPTLNERVSEALGRPFAIEGDLSVQWRREPGETGWRSWVPWPRFTADDIWIANPGWAKEPRFATLRSVTFRLAPLPLLAQRIVIPHIQLTAPAANLERQADGQANWVFQLPADDSQGGPSRWQLRIDEIGFDQGRVTFNDAKLDAQATVIVDPLGKPVPFSEIAGSPPSDESPQTAPDYVFGWKVDGRYKKQPVSGSGRIGGMLALRGDNLPFPLQADVRVAQTRIALAGTLTNPMQLGALDLRLKLAGNSMGDLYPLTGVTLPDTPPYSTDGHLTADLQNPAGAVFNYRKFSGKVGDSDLHGDLTYASTSPRPKLTGTFSSNLLQLVDLGPLVGVQPEGKAPPAGSRVQPANKVLPVDTFRTDRWRAMDAQVEFTGKRIVHGKGLPLENLRARVGLDDGVLTLDPLRFSMAGGTLNSTIRLDGSKTPMRGNIDMSTRGLKLKQLFPDFEPMRTSLGEINGDAKLAGTGNSVAALLGTADGELKLLINDGAISRALTEIAGLNLANYVVTELFGDDEVKINCAAADLAVDDGVARTRLFLFDTENALVNIDGTASFRDETLDLDITPHSKGLRIISLRSPLYVKGTFKKPSAGVQPGALIARGAGALLLGVFVTPAASLLALIAPSTGQENACSQLLAQMREPPKVQGRKPAKK